MKINAYIEKLLVSQLIKEFYPNMDISLNTKFTIKPYPGASLIQSHLSNINIAKAVKLYVSN
jgi:hypothetical protein